MSQAEDDATPARGVASATLRAEDVMHLVEARDRDAEMRADSLAACAATCGV
jgi:hypothetical protein